jgi:hypothetical protein
VYIQTYSEIKSNELSIPRNTWIDVKSLNRNEKIQCQKVTKGASHCWWLMPAILTTQDVEIRRISVQSQPRKIVLGELISKKPFTKKGWWNGSWCRP